MPTTNSPSSNDDRVERTTLDATLTGGSFRRTQDAVEIVAGAAIPNSDIPDQ